jgi:hypothetical protein
MWLRFRARNEDRRAQHVAHVELFLPGVIAQQVLGEKDSDHVVLVLPDHREAGVPGLDHHGDELVGGLLDVDDVHLRARHHDVARLHLGDLQHALDHGERVGIEQVPLVGGAQQLDQLLPILRLAREPGAEALEQRGLGGGNVCHHPLSP